MGIKGLADYPFEGAPRNKGRDNKPTHSLLHCLSRSATAVQIIDLTDWLSEPKRFGSSLLGRVSGLDSHAPDPHTGAQCDMVAARVVYRSSLSDLRNSPTFTFSSGLAVLRAHKPLRWLSRGSFICPDRREFPCTLGRHSQCC